MPRNFTDKSGWNSATTKLNATSVPIAGETNSLFQNLGLPCPPAYGSQDDVGKRFLLTESDLVPLASSQFLLASGAAMFGCIVQLVLLDSGATAANVAPGLAAFILNTATGGAAGSGALAYSVTDESHTVALSHLCGTFLFAATPGQYTYIAIGGKIPVQYRAAVTANTQGGAIIVQGAGTGVFDCPAQGGAPTFGQWGQIIGNAISQPANGAIGTVFTKYLLGRY
jgi:hypothetical protein